MANLLIRPDNGEAGPVDWIIPQTTPIALVSMPMLSARDPSFQLGLLKPTLERAGFNVQAFSLYMYFGRFVGWPLQEALAEVWPSMVGEWIWSKAAYDYEGDPPAYFRAYERNFDHICKLAGCSLADIARVRDEVVPEFLAYVVDEIDWSRFGLIGCSVVFQQLGASVAFARALGKKYPELPVIFGGAGFEDDIASEVMQRCDAVDYLHCGDGDVTFPQFIERLYTGASMEGLPGVMWRDGKDIHYAGRAPNLPDLDSTPVPDFDEYFYARAESGYEGSGHTSNLWLPIETARGCWWGMKNHCTFCGLNRSGMEFRAKDAARVLGMLRELSRRYGRVDFNAIDNIIEPSYIEGLFGKLAEERTDYRIHYEVRANLSRTQLRLMKQGGLHSVQAGVESLNTHLLKLMRKNITGMRNLEFMKWCTYYGIDNVYNILVGFAGEHPEDYASQVELIRKIPHLQPPYAIARARADRGSPMLEERDGNGVRNVTPAACYRYIFPEQFDLSRISYYFEHESDQILHDYNEIFSVVGTWQQAWKQRPKPYLRLRKLLDTIVLEDGRWGASQRHVFVDQQAALYEYCHSARRRSDIGAHFQGDWVDVALEQFVRLGITVAMDDKYLSIALPMNPNH